MHTLEPMRAHERDQLHWIHTLKHTHNSSGRFILSHRKGINSIFFPFFYFSGLMVKTWSVITLLVIWSLTFLTNFSADELISCSHSTSLLFCESSRHPAEQLSLNGSRRLLKPSFTPTAAALSAGVKSYKPETNTDEIWLMLQHFTPPLL